MTDRISTEEAERVAGEVKETARRLWKWDQWLDDAAAADRAAAALRALAAERDALTDRIEQMRDVARSGLSGWIAPSSTPLRAIEKIADAALGEGGQMSEQRFTTEEAERIAEWIDCYHGFGCGCANKAAADALRDLAAERDELRVALGEALDTSAGCPTDPPCGNCKFCRAFKVYAAGSQP